LPSVLCHQRKSGRPVCRGGIESPKNMGVACRQSLTIQRNAFSACATHDKPTHLCLGQC
jgi:hypothetical protein